MLTYEQMQFIYTDLISLVSDIDVTYGTGSGEKTVSLDTSVLWVNQFEYETFPSITLNFTSFSNEYNSPLGENLEFTTEFIDSEELTYSSSQNIYDLTYNDINYISEIRGTVNGSNYTFDSADYEIVNKEAPNGDNADNIEFVGTTPDNGSNFYINYYINMLQFYRNRTMTDSLSVNVYTKRDRDKDYNEVAVNHLLTKKVSEYFDILDRDDLVPLQISEIQDLTDLGQTENVVRRQFDVDLKHAVEERGKTTPRILGISSNINI